MQNKNAFIFSIIMSCLNEEKHIYGSIKSLVRENCNEKKYPFHTFKIFLQIKNPSISVSYITAPFMDWLHGIIQKSDRKINN